MRHDGEESHVMKNKPTAHGMIDPDAAVHPDKQLGTDTRCACGAPLRFNTDVLMGELLEDCGQGASGEYDGSG